MVSIKEGSIKNTMIRLALAGLFILAIGIDFDQVVEVVAGNNQTLSDRVQLIKGSVVLVPGAVNIRTDQS